jgi:hypothetical protein
MIFIGMINDEVKQRGLVWATFHICTTFCFRSIGGKVINFIDHKPNTTHSGAVPRNQSQVLRLTDIIYNQRPDKDNYMSKHMATSERAVNGKLVFVTCR